LEKPKRTYRFKRIDTHNRTSIGIIVLVIILLLVPAVMHSPYYIHLLIMVGINAALAMTFIFLLRVGLINLSIASFWGIGAYASAMLTMRLNLSFWLALPAATIISGVVALIVGLLLCRNSGFGFIIPTLAFASVVVLILGTFDVFGGYVGIVNIPHPEPIAIPFLPVIEFTSKTPYYYLMLFLVAVVITAFYAFYSASTGRAWRAIGLSSSLAESLGVNLFKYRLTAFIISSSACGLMGSFYAHYYSALVPLTFAPFPKTIYCHIFAILGGIGFPFAGPAIGAFILTIAPELLRATGAIEPILTGLLVILLVLFAPTGILGLATSGWSSMHPSESIDRIGKWIKASLPTSRTDRENRK